MRPDLADAVFDSFDRAMVIVSPGGSIQFVNQAGLDLFGVPDRDTLVDRPIAEFVQSSESTLQSLLRATRRTSAVTLGSLQFVGSDQHHRVECQRLRLGDGNSLILRIKPQRAAIRQFVALNERLDRLNEEISRRRAAEADLRIERDIAEFGRDIGMALVHSRHLIPALDQCTQLMVDRLGAAFARIWRSDPQKQELQLVASSGMYTHLDGDHSRIKFGEFKIGRIAASQQPHLTNDVIGDDQVHNQQWAEREGMVAFAGYPLVDGEETVGVMALFSRDPLSETVIASLGSVANSIALRIRKQSIEDGLAEQARALRDSDRRKDEFLAMLSHELRNPLAPVRTGLDLLAMDNSDHQDTIELMQHQVNHLVRLVDDLLDVSRIMRGKVQLRREPTDLKAVIQQAIESLSEPLTDRQIEMQLGDDPIWIHADPVRMKQVIENLIRNACKYSDAGSRVQLTLDPDDSSVRFQVRDFGIGIEPSLIPHLFELFTQSPRSLDRSQGGLGIGLTLVKSLVEMHGGTVSAESAGIGHGSRFNVELPRCKPPASKSAPVGADESTEASCPPLKILAVDDNRSARVVLARLFERLGPHQVETADDGRSALETFEHFQPDLVLLDIGLPEMDGYAVAQAMRQRRPDNQFLLVALTGYGRKEDRIRSERAGFDEHLVKPPGIKQLRNLLTHPKLHQRFPPE